jgi:hypothetical protein
MYYSEIDEGTGYTGYSEALTLVNSHANPVAQKNWK